MSHRGFSHFGLSTLDLDRTRDFYENVLKFTAVRKQVKAAGYAIDDTPEGPRVRSQQLQPES